VGGSSERNSRTASACVQNGHAIHSADDSGRAGATGASQRGHASVPAASWVEPARYDVRNFYPKDGAVLEDPVWGSFNASLGEWLLQSGHRPVRRPSQNSDRPCRRRARHANEDGVLWGGGTTSTDIAGTVEL
jgi:predicted PhzF superfamily epimerase YddE/YHI9